MSRDQSQEKSCGSSLKCKSLLEEFEEMIEPNHFDQRCMRPVKTKKKARMDPLKEAKLKDRTLNLMKRAKSRNQGLNMCRSESTFIKYEVSTSSLSSLSKNSSQIFEEYGSTNIQYQPT